MAEEVPASGSPPQLDPSKGGYARADKLTPEERQKIARRAAEARWGIDTTKATHAGIITIAGQEIISSDSF